MQECGKRGKKFFFTFLEIDFLLMSHFQDEFDDKFFMMFSKKKIYPLSL